MMPWGPMNVISVRDLRKSYRDLEAIREISFDIPEGFFFTFLTQRSQEVHHHLDHLLPPEIQLGVMEVFRKDVFDPLVKVDIGVVSRMP